MSQQDALQKFAHEVIEAHDLIRAFGLKGPDKKRAQEAMDFLPAAAGRGFLFASEKCGKIVSLAIAGPTQKPGSLHSLTYDGMQLYVHYALVHPQWRFLRKGLYALEEMLVQACSRYPQCEVLCYWHGGSYRERAFQQGRVEWVGRRSAQVATLP